VIQKITNFGDFLSKIKFTKITKNHNIRKNKIFWNILTKFLDFFG